MSYTLACSYQIDANGAWLDTERRIELALERTSIGGFSDGVTRKLVFGFENIENVRSATVMLRRRYPRVVVDWHEARSTVPR